MANFLFDTKEFMEDLFEKEFYRIINNVSFYKNWLNKFITIIVNYQTFGIYVSAHLS